MDAPEENIILYTCYPLGQVSLTDMRYFIYGKYVQRSAAGGAVLSRPGKQAAAARLAVAVQLVAVSVRFCWRSVWRCLYAPAGRTFCRCLKNPVIWTPFTLLCWTPAVSTLLPLERLPIRLPTP